MANVTNEVLNGILTNFLSLFFIAAAFLLAVSNIFTSINPKHIKVKKRLITQDSRLIEIARKVISKNIILSKLNDRIRIQLGLITSKGEVKNEIYAVRIMISLFMFIIVESTYIVFFTKYPFLFKPLLILLGIIIPYVLIDAYLRTLRKRIYNDFPELVSIFITKYASKRNVKEALKRSIPELPKNLRYEVKRLVNTMNHAESYYRALDEFDERVNYVMCTAFVALIKTAFKTNADIIENLMELENYIAQERLESQRKVEQLKEKKMNLYLIMAAMPGAYYLIVNRLQEKAINFYWHTIMGQTVIGLSILFSIITIVAILLEDHL